jgi:anaphase-promoting complex subunit 1
MNREAKEHIQIELSVQNHRRPWADPSSGSVPSSRPDLATMPVAIAKKVVRLKGQSDALKIQDGRIARVLCLRNRGVESTLQLYAPWSPETAYTVSLDRLRIFNPYDAGLVPSSSPRTVGKQRTLLETKALTQISNSGPHGIVSLRDIDGKLHQIQLQLSPRNDTLARLLRVLLFVMPSWLGDYFLCIWWNRYMATHEDVRNEWHAFALAIFSIALALDEGATGRRKSEVQNPKSSPSKSRKVSVSSLEAFEHMLQCEVTWGDNAVPHYSGWSWTNRTTTSGMKAPSSVAALVSEARDFVRSKVGQDVSSPLRASPELVRLALSRILASLHLFREELKFDNSTEARDILTIGSIDLGIVIAQLGRWMSWTSWDWKDGHYYAAECPSHSGFDDATIRACSGLAHPLASQNPPSLYAWLEQALLPGFSAPFASLDSVLNVPLSPHLQAVCERFFPRTTAMSKYLLVLHAPELAPEKQVQAISESRITSKMLETFPDAVSAILRDAIVQCQASPPTTWSAALLELINRDDLMLLASGQQPQPKEPEHKLVSPPLRCKDVKTNVQRSLLHLAMRILLHKVLK